MTLRNYYVYGIPYAPDHPEYGGKPCYVGMGRNGRMHDHLKHARWGRKNSKSEYLRGCLLRGIEPAPYVIASNMTKDEAIAVEIALIGHYGRIELGGCLLNITAGGQGGRSPTPSMLAKQHTPESDAKRGAARLGKKHPEEVKAKIGRAHKGRLWSAESRARLSAARMGHKASEEAKAKMRASSPKARRPHSEEAKLKNAQAHIGRMASEHAKANMRAAAAKRVAKGYLPPSGLGKKRAKQTCASISTSLRGKPKSPEHRASMKAAAQAREARKRTKVRLANPLVDS